MIWPFVPALLALCIVLAAPHALRSRRWAVHRPDLAIRCWVGLIVVGAGLLAITVVAIMQSTIRAATRPPDPRLWVEQTVFAIAAWGSLVAIGGLLALVWARSEPLADADRVTRRVLNRVARSATYDQESLAGIEVRYVDIDHPLALGARFGGRRILVSRGLRDALTHGELRAVLEHERGHLVRRHHLVLRLAAINAACFPSLRGARDFERNVHLLIEMSADDHAAGVVGPALTADALDRLADVLGLASAAMRAERIRQRCRTQVAAGQAAVLL